jgi:hypothetical protein
MSKPKRHHFVPKAYLEGFTEEKSGFLNVYSRRVDQWRRQKPKQVMVRNNYYHQHWAPEGIDKNILETALGGVVEPKGLAALSKLVERPGQLDDDDSANILLYLEFQRLRVPRQAEMAKALAETVLRSYLMQSPEGREALKFGKITIKDEFRIEFMRLALRSSTPYLSRMIWELIRAADGTSFVTSDSPVSFFNADFLPPMEPGVGLFGTIVLFPIDRRHLLLMRHPEYGQGIRGPSEQLPRNLEVQDGVIEIRKDIVWQPEVVRQHNWRMFHLCQDMIVGKTKEVLEDAVGKKLGDH